MLKRVVIGLLVAVLVAGITFGVSGKVSRYMESRRAAEEQNSVVLPPPEHVPSSSSVAPASSTASVAPASSADSLHAEVNYAVPFTPQAPTGNWDAVHEEACEEASVLMVLRYFEGKTIPSAADGEAGIQTVLAKNDELGFPVDDTAAQVVQLIHALNSSLHASLLQNPTEESVKKALSQGSLVIVPAAGRQLGNPYFSGAGPLYHMLMIRGYTKDGYAITNDPGTKRGEAYVYRWSALLSATHDWNGGDVVNGEKVVVVVSK